MDLVEAYRDHVKPCIVSFVRKFVVAPEPGQSLPEFPEILGTEFVIDADGLLATNRHVAEAFLDAPPEILEATDGAPVMATFLWEDREAIQMQSFDVEAAWTMEAPDKMLTRYQPNQPDIAFVQINVRGLKAMELDVQSVVHEGMEMATAGFPMGTDALMPQGHLAQVSPMLQRGIVSAVLPFPSEFPHGFVLNVMSRGGASGSPVFFPDSGRLAGILHAALTDIEVTSTYRHGVPTAFTYVIPARVVGAMLDDLKASNHVKLPNDAPQFSQLVERARAEDTGQDGEFPWTPFFPKSS